MGTPGMGRGGAKEGGGGKWLGGGGALAASGGGVGVGAAAMGGRPGTTKSCWQVGQAAVLAATDSSAEMDWPQCGQGKVSITGVRWRGPHHDTGK